MEALGNLERRFHHMGAAHTGTPHPLWASMLYAKRGKRAREAFVLLQEKQGEKARFIP
jgi:hypothetical protein